MCMIFQGAPIPLQPYANIGLTDGVLKQAIHKGMLPLKMEIEAIVNSPLMDIAGPEGKITKLAALCTEYKMGHTEIAGAICGQIRWNALNISETTGEGVIKLYSDVVSIALAPSLFPMQERIRIFDELTGPAADRALSVLDELQRDQMVQFVRKSITSLGLSYDDVLDRIKNRALSGDSGAARLLGDAAANQWPSKKGEIGQTQHLARQYRAASIGV